MTNSPYNISCGVRQLYGLWADLNYLKQLHRDRGAAFYVFSDVAHKGNSGEVVMKMIRKHKLGTVTASSGARNPNSGNQIKVYIWKVA